MVTLHLRHRSSLEGVIFPSPQCLPPQEHDKATELFNKLIQYFEPLEKSYKDYKPITLIRLMEEEVSAEDEYLIFFFTLIEHDQPGVTDFSLADTLARLHDFDRWTSEKRHVLFQSLVHIANYLVDNFFLPLKSYAAKTPQFTPISHISLNSSDPAIGTQQRISNLRKTCLTRDRHRCVVTRKFDVEEAEKRYDIHRESFKDDDGNLLRHEGDDMTPLEVAHIIPHSFMSHSVIEGRSQLTKRKQMAHHILKMFNPGVVHAISGTDIDRPMNALTLTHDLHRSFGRFDIAFEPVQGHPHSYKIGHTKPNPMIRHRGLPVTRTLYLTPDRNIEPPSPQLLELHRAIGRILHLSAAGEYINYLRMDMEDMRERIICTDGSTRIDDYVHYKLAADLDQRLAWQGLASRR